jgi:hypothetical protein
MLKRLKNEWVYVKAYWLVVFLSSRFYRLSLRLAKEIHNYWLVYNQAVNEPLKKILNAFLGPLDKQLKILP